MRLRGLIICVLLSLLFSEAGLAQGRDNNLVIDRGDLVEDLLLQYYELYRFNGAVLVAEQDEIIYENSFGFADFESLEPLDNETPFYLASLSKQFTAAAIMKLVEEGKLSLDDPATLYFPQLPKTYTQVKIYNLLNHTAGLPDYLNSAEARPGITNQDVYRYLTERNRLEFTPGSKFKYSNSGYALLAMIVEVTTGKSISDYFTENFFLPLGMKHTYVHTAFTLDIKRARGYDVKYKSNDYGLYTVGDGGVYSTASDLFVWMQALNQGMLISQASLDKMYQPVKLQSGRERRYGYGWELGNNTSGPLYYHSGELAGFRTYIERQNSTGSTIVILTNNSFSKIGDLRNNLVKILDGRMTSIPEY